MSTSSDNTQQATTDGQQTGNQSSSQAPGGSTSEANGSGSAGLTLEQLQAFAETFAKNYSAQQPVAQPAQQQPSVQYQPTDPFAGRDGSDWVTVEEAKTRLSEHMMNNVAQRFGPAFQEVWNMGLNFAETNSKKENPVVWQKFGNEVKAILDKKRQDSGVVRPQDFQDAVDTVKGRHVDAFADDILKQRMQSMPVTEGGGGMAGSPQGMAVTNDWPDEWRKRFRDLGMSDVQVVDFVRKTGQTMEQFTKNLKNHSVIITPSGIWEKNPNKEGQ